MNKEIKNYGQYIEKIGNILQKTSENQSPLINQKQIELLGKLIDSTESLIELIETYKKLNIKALA